jgi:hypothetical protein
MIEDIKLEGKEFKRLPKHKVIPDSLEIRYYRPMTLEHTELNKKYGKVLREAQKKHINFMKLDNPYRTYMTLKDEIRKEAKKEKRPLGKKQTPDDRKEEPKSLPTELPHIFGIHKWNLDPMQEMMIGPLGSMFEPEKDYSQKKLFDVFEGKFNKVLHSKKFKHMAITMGPGRKSLRFINMDMGTMEGRLMRCV